MWAIMAQGLGRASSQLTICAANAMRWSENGWSVGMVTSVTRPPALATAWAMAWLALPSAFSAPITSIGAWVRLGVQSRTFQSLPWATISSATAFGLVPA